MKVRDYVFWTCLTLTSLIVSHALRVQFVQAQPAVARRASFWERAVFVYGLWKLSHAVQDAPPGTPAGIPADVQTLPDSVVNAPPDRADGPDGHPLIAHGAGW
jgi:hypothetical protein